MDTGRKWRFFHTQPAFDAPVRRSRLGYQKDCINCTAINAFKEHIQRNRKHYNNSVSFDSELHRQQPVLTFAIVGGVAEFGEIQ